MTPFARGLEPSWVRARMWPAARTMVSFGFALCAATAGGDTRIPAKPVKIAGRFCGRALDPSHAIVPNVILRLSDEAKHDSLVAEIRADSSGDFAFPSVPAGKYHLTASGWILSGGEIQVTGQNRTRCRHALTVILGIMACSGGISKKRPSHHQEPQSDAN